jgi:hypothetical protein
MGWLETRAEIIRRDAFAVVSFWIAKSLMLVRAFLTVLLIQKQINTKRYDCFWVRRKTKGSHYIGGYFLSIAMGYIKGKNESLALVPVDPPHLGRPICILGRDTGGSD